MAGYLIKRILQMVGVLWVVSVVVFVMMSFTGDHILLTSLNLGPSATLISSNRTISTLVILAPSSLIRCSAISRFSAVLEETTSATTSTS